MDIAFSLLFTLDLVLSFHKSEYVFCVGLLD